MTHRIKDNMDDTAFHHKTLFDTMRGEVEIVQDATFGLRVVVPVLARNIISQESGKVVNLNS